MTEDDDIALSLPQAPPPAPARREATIEAALRRFDGAPAPAPANTARATPALPSRWWARITRPQLGAALATALVGIIFAPIAWDTVSQAPLAPRSPAVNEEVAGVGLPPMAAPPPQVAPAPPAEQPDAAAPPTIVQIEPELSVPAPVVAEPANMAQKADAREDARAASAGVLADREAAPVMAEATRNRAVAGQAMGGFARALPPPPPPAPPAAVAAAAPPAPAGRMERSPPATAATAPMAARKPMASADSVASEADAQNIIVTAAKRRAARPGRGDWNACTLDDPKQSLTACKYLVNPAAKGAKGRAAAPIADGLSLGWRGDMGGAIAAFDKAITVAPKSSLAYLNRGIARQRQGDSDGALADFDQAIRLSPGGARGYYHRGQLLRERGDTRRARADAARAVSLDSDYQAVVE